MLKPTCLALALAAAVTTSALAAPPADQAACNKLSFDLAEKAADKKLAKADAEKIDSLLVKLEEQCAGSKFADAETTAKDVEAALAK